MITKNSKIFAISNERNGGLYSFNELRQLVRVVAKTELSFPEKGKHIDGKTEVEDVFRIKFCELKKYFEEQDDLSFKKFVNEKMGEGFSFYKDYSLGVDLKRRMVRFFQLGRFKK